MRFEAQKYPMNASLVRNKYEIMIVSRSSTHRVKRAFVVLSQSSESILYFESLLLPPKIKLV
jgi:hypothetical protein